MVELHFVYVALYAVAAVLALVVAVVAWQHRSARGARPLAVLMVGVIIWSGAAAALWYVPTLRQQVFWLSVEDLGIWMIPVGFLTLAFDIAGMDRWLGPGRVALISIVSFALINIEWLNPGRLFDESFVAHAIGSYTQYESIPGPLYWTYVVFAYSMIAVAFVIMVRVYIRSRGAERTQAAILIAGALVAFVASTLTELGTVPLDLDLAPLAVLAIGPLWLAAILRGTILDVLPLARGVLVEQMLDGVLVIDENDRVVDANPAALRILSAPAADVIGKPADAVLGSMGGANAVLGDGGPRCAVLPTGPHGARRDVELAITSLVIGRGKPPAQLVTLHDVTEERRAREAMRESQARLSLALRSANMGAWDWDVIEDRRHFDEQVCRLLGIDCSTFTGTDEEFFRAVHPDDAEKVRAALARTIEQDAPYEPEYRTVWPDGSVHDVAARGRLARDDDGRPTRINGILWDITEHKHVEQVLRESEASLAAVNKSLEERVAVRTRELSETVDDLVEANEAKTRFLRSMSHELRTPLNSVIGFSSLLANGVPGDVNEEQLRQLAMIQSAGQSLLYLINDILDLSRIEAGRVTRSIQNRSMSPSCSRSWSLR